MKKREEVLSAFKTQQNNTVPILAKQFNMSNHAIHKIIDSCFVPPIKKNKVI